MADGFDRQVSLILDEMKSPKQQSAMLARFAREQIAKTKIENETAIGATIRNPLITVDGKRSAALGTVRPDGTIVAEFNAETNALQWILRELALISPELTGAYERSHTVFADGAEIDVGISGNQLPDAREYVIASDLPYARKLDPSDDLPARSKQAPKGVYAAIAAVAASRFGDQADIRFTFRDAPLRNGSHMRQPAIVVRPT